MHVGKYIKADIFYVTYTFINVKPTRGNTQNTKTMFLL